MAHGKTIMTAGKTSKTTSKLPVTHGKTSMTAGKLRVTHGKISMTAGITSMTFGKNYDFVCHVSDEGNSYGNFLACQ